MDDKEKERLGYVLSKMDDTQLKNLEQELNDKLKIVQQIEKDK